MMTQQERPPHQSPQRKLQAPTAMVAATSREAVVEKPKV